MGIVNERMSGKAGLASAFILTFFLSGLLGWTFASWRSIEAYEGQTQLLRRTQAELRCFHYWTNRSGVADAEFEFRHGRRALLEIMGAEDPSTEYQIPGARDGMGAGVRR